jgi:hypothetical protein
VRYRSHHKTRVCIRALLNRGVKGLARHEVRKRAQPFCTLLTSMLHWSVWPQWTPWSSTRPARFTGGTTQLLSLQVLPGSPYSRATLLAMAQSAQRLSVHPLAAAFVPRPQPPSAALDPAAADPLYAPHQVQLLLGLGLQVTLCSRLQAESARRSKPPTLRAKYAGAIFAC